MAMALVKFMLRIFVFWDAGIGADDFQHGSFKSIAI
jgi:hypothetical protein